MPTATLTSSLLPEYSPRQQEEFIIAVLLLDANKAVTVTLQSTELVMELAVNLELCMLPLELAILE